MVKNTVVQVVSTRGPRERARDKLKEWKREWKKGDKSEWENYVYLDRESERKRARGRRRERESNTASRRRRRHHDQASCPRLRWAVSFPGRAFLVQHIQNRPALSQLRQAAATAVQVSNTQMHTRKEKPRSFGVAIRTAQPLQSLLVTSISITLHLTVQKHSLDNS